MSNSALERVIAESKSKEAAKAAEQEARDKKFKDMAAAIGAKEAAEKAEQQKRIDADKAAREANADEAIEQEARELFFSSNAGASESTYQSVREDCRKTVLLRRAEQAQGGLTGLYRKHW